MLGLAAIAVFSIVLPAIGAPSPDQLVKRALGLAKKADKRAKMANRRARKADKRARRALGLARGAQPGAIGPVGPRGKPGAQGPAGEDADSGAEDTWHRVGSEGEPAFVNGWQNYVSSARGSDLEFTKNPDDEVFLRGQIDGGAVSSNCSNQGQVFQLPEDYRPGQYMYFPILTTDGSNTITPGWAAVDIDGTVCVGVGDNSFVNFAISFKAG